MTSVSHERFTIGSFSRSSPDRLCSRPSRAERSRTGTPRSAARSRSRCAPRPSAHRSRSARPFLQSGLRPYFLRWVEDLSLEGLVIGHGAPPLPWTGDEGNGSRRWPAAPTEYRRFPWHLVCSEQTQRLRLQRSSGASTPVTNAAALRALREQIDSQPAGTPRVRRSSGASALFV